MPIWNLGIIGCGWAGEQHARAIMALDNKVRLIGVADIDKDRSKDFAARWGAPFWTEDYNSLISQDELQAVSVCLPHQLHHEAALESARAGLHILMEKPLAATLTEADEMIAAAESADVILMVAENVRFHTSYNQVAQIVSSGKLGEIFLLRISREHNMRSYLHERPWFLSDPYAGIMMSGGIHDFELLRMIAGEIDHVYAITGNKVFREMDTDDNSVALVGLKSGAAAVIIETFSLRTPESGVSGSVHGSLGSLWFDGKEIHIYRSEQDNRPDLIDSVSIDPTDTFVAEMEHFLDCLSKIITNPITSGREERNPLAAVQAAYKSMLTGERVFLAEFGDLRL